MRLKNGGIIGPENIPSRRSASGMWALADASEYIKDGLWPPTSTSALYDFSSFTFTNGTQTGRFGPSLQNLLSSYDTNENFWLEETEIFDVQDGIQLWTVPQSGSYTIEAWGARGGNNTISTGFSGGLGSRMRGDFDLIQGEVLQILVGQHGLDGSSSCSGYGGGGGSFVVRQAQGDIQESDILMVAGGGGGGGNGPHATLGRKNATTSNDGLAGDRDASSSGLGGTSGNGGLRGTGCVVAAGGGAGIFGNGDSAGGTGGGAGLSFVNGGAGGVNGSSSGGSSSGGGFGGGGGGERGGGGGGGYSGGGGGGLATCSCADLASGGGGGSFNSGTNQDNESGVGAGHGQVEITKL